MPRIRSIKPEFWSDSKIGQLPIWGRLLYIGLWSFADDNGVCEDDPQQLKALIFPYDPITPTDLKALLEMLSKGDRILRYSVGQKDYILVKRFSKHQSPERPTSRYPVPNPLPDGFAWRDQKKGLIQYIGDTSPTSHRHIDESSALEKEKELEKEEDMERGSAAPSAEAHSPSNNLPNWLKVLHELKGWPQDAVANEEVQNKTQVHFGHLNLEEEAQKFVWHWQDSRRKLKSARRAWWNWLAVAKGKDVGQGAQPEGDDFFAGLPDTSWRREEKQTEG